MGGGERDGQGEGRVTDYAGGGIATVKKYDSACTVGTTVLTVPSVCTYRNTGRRCADSNSTHCVPRTGPSHSPRRQFCPGHVAHSCQ